MTVSRRLFSDRMPFLICLALFFSAPYYLLEEIGPVRLSLDSFFVALLLLYGVVQVVAARGPVRYVKVPFFRLWVVFLVLTLVGFVLGEGNLNSPIQAVWAVYRNAELLLVYPIVVQALNSPRRIKLAVGALLLGIALAASIGVVQSVSGGRYLSGLSENGNHRYIGLFYRTPYDPQKVQWLAGAAFFRAHGPSDSPNLFAALLNMGLVVGLALLLTGALSKGRQTLAVGGVAVIGAALLASQSRSGWVAATAACCIMVLLIVRPSPRLLLRVGALVGLTLILASLGFQVLPEGLRARFDTIRNPTEAVEIQGRFEVWRIALETIRDNPLFGLGTDRIRGSQLVTWGSNPPDVSPHNLFLAAAYQNGIPYLLTLLALLLVLMITGLRTVFWGSIPFYRSLGLATVGLITTLVVHGMLDSLLQPRTHQLLFWSLVGLLASAVIQTRKQQAAVAPEPARLVATTP